MTRRIALLAWSSVALTLALTVHALLGGTHVVAAAPPADAAIRARDRQAVRGVSPAAAPRPPIVGVTVLTFVDRSRSIVVAHHRTPRTLVVVIRYPALGAPSRRGDSANAAPAKSGGPYPLVVFGHGFNVTPATYSGLLDAWTRAGYVVAAPVFPLENADAPGGPNESDIVNQPADMSFVITHLLAASRAPTGLLSGLIDPAHIAVAGHSDGAETALAVAYVPRYLDRRVDAAVILSGAGFGTQLTRFPAGTPPLLAVQGTADPINLPGNTSAYYRIARPPKYLLWLLGASHLPPYTGQQPWFGIVERVSTAFLDLYLKAERSAGQRLLALGDVPGAATTTAQR